MPQLGPDVSLFPHPLPRLPNSVAEGRFVEERLVMTNAAGVRHPAVSGVRRHVLDLTCLDDWDGGFPRVSDPLVFRTSLPLVDGRTVPREAAVSALGWYKTTRSEHPQDLVIVNCLVGAQRSAAMAYAILRGHYLLPHDVAFRRVATRATKAMDTRFWPSDPVLAEVKEWCDSGCP